MPNERNNSWLKQKDYKRRVYDCFSLKLRKTFFCQLITQKNQNKILILKKTYESVSLSTKIRHFTLLCVKEKLYNNWSECFPGYKLKLKSNILVLTWK